NILRYENTSTIQRSVGSSWVTMHSWTIPKQDDNHLMEICRLEFEAEFGTSTGYARLLINGNLVQEFGPYEAEGGRSIRIGTLIDFRGYPFGQNTFEIRFRRAQSSSVTMRLRNIRVYQNDQLPLRPGIPMYSVTPGRPAGGCFTHCQQTCQGSSQIGCPGCESNCQTSCESGCQGTCESSSQGGGGCIREGTPITIWDQELQAYREIPVEQLKPGMILPGYAPETDTLEHGHLIALHDAKFSSRFLRIHTDKGPSVDVTFEQPFDVLADLGDGWKWHKLPAKYL